MSYPPQAPPQYYGPPPAFQPPAKKGAGLAIASMVLGIIALLLSWIPIVNNVAAVIAVVGLGLGIPALLRARRGTHGGTGMAVTGLVTSVLAIVVVFATQAFYADVIDEVQEELDRAGDEVSAPPAGDAAPAGAEEAPVADTVPLGVPAQVGDYQVIVDAVELDGNAIAAAGNQFNEPATNGQYVVVQLTATYTGAEEGFPGMDLTAVVHGNDNRQYSDAECMALLPDDAMNAPTLNPGGTDTFQFCMDVPPAALAGAELSVEPTISFGSDERVFYALG
ncbi:DUF4190 domain-containing protein [Blastococcus sp. MG754426]|uniref:DUF4190 domain-containing protein n=1 Tax=unclassified Blastococcus TaxID=2619396 RepID=UPI001EF0FC32|nr:MULTISPECIES: DUF4190 domain-containing protein [unclassified Blastococcus]MCF6506942.1 DUF4190 domain-containing protein [Blastococcus sp. MG754426]MCF6511812.1 DUF4190 domain-containing protein [Blastococcus sp. MG754427]MCF6735966.1 DUF4190 domain-containing protein [Blastococcus sp. KM273129]